MARRCCKEEGPAAWEVTAFELKALANRAQYCGQVALSLALEVVAAAENAKHTNALVLWLRPFAEGGIEAIREQHPDVFADHGHKGD